MTYFEMGIQQFGVLDPTACRDRPERARNGHKRNNSASAVDGTSHSFGVLDGITEAGGRRNMVLLEVRRAGFMFCYPHSWT